MIEVVTLWQRHSLIKAHSLVVTEALHCHRHYIITKAFPYQIKLVSCDRGSYIKTEAFPCQSAPTGWESAVQRNNAQCTDRVPAVGAHSAALHAVSDDGGATVALWRSPPQLRWILVDGQDLGLARYTGLLCWDVMVAVDYAWLIVFVERRLIYKESNGMAEMSKTLASNHDQLFQDLDAFIATVLLIYK